MISYFDFKNICTDGDIYSVESLIKDIESGNKHTMDGWQSWKNYWNYGFSGACRGGHLDIMDLMIKKGADCWNLGLKGACEGGHLDIIDLMIKKGANDWNWGLEGACEGGHLDIINSMIERGAANWNLGLHGACFGKHLDIIKMVIRKGARAWTYIFRFVREMIDADIVKLMAEKKMPFEHYLKYPKSKKLIFKFHELGLSVDMLKNIKGFDNFIKDIEKRQNSIRPIISNHTIDDLTEIIVEYVIN